MKHSIHLVNTLLCLCLTETLCAEEADTLKVVHMDEVTVVTAPKENRRLRELPTSVTLLSNEQMKAAHVKGIKGLTGVVPNIFVPDYGSRLTSAVYIRGVGSRINTPSVGLYVDNIPYINQSAFDFNYADVERIDVLRGPQGTLYGRNAMGGLIKIHTKSPFSYQGTDLRLSAATHGSYAGSLTHYHRVNDRFAFSTGGFYTYDDGFFKNAALDNRKIDRGQSAGGRLRAIYLTPSNLKFDFTANYEYSDQGGYPYGLYDPESGETAQPAYNRESNYYRNLLNTGLNITWQAEHFTLSAVTGYQWVKDRMFLDQDFTALDIYTLEQKQQIHTFSEEIVLKSRPGTRWQWTTGAFGFYQSLKTIAPVTFRSDGMSMLNQMLGSVIPQEINVAMGPMTMQIAPSLGITSTEMPIPGDFSTPQYNLALFHQSTFQELLGIEGLSLTAGLRLDYEKMKIDYDSHTTLDYQVGIGGKLLLNDILLKEIEMMPTTDLSLASGYQGNFSKDYWQLLPKVSLQYDLQNQRGNLYLSVSKGYRSGGYNIQMFSDLLQAGLRNDMMRQTKEEVMQHVPEAYQSMVDGFFPEPGENPDARKAVEYKPEQTWSYEIGTHMNLIDNRLQADASLFWMDTKNQQISRFAASGLGRETANAGQSRSRGAEVALTAAVTRDFQLTTSYGYTHAKFIDYQLGTAETDYTGNMVPFVPRHTLHIDGNYTFHLQPQACLDRIVVGANYSGQGKIYWTESNQVCQSFYGTVGGRVSLQKGNGSIDLWVRNLFDTDYAAFYFETMGNGFLQKGRPLQAGIELRCRF